MVGAFGSGFLSNPTETKTDVSTQSNGRSCAHRFFCFGAPARTVLIGGRRGILHTIKVLYAKGYADPNDWSDLLPTGRPDEWMSILTKRWRIE